MIQHMIREQVIYGRFAEYFEAVQEWQSAAAERGLPRYRLLGPVVGTANEVVFQGEYSSLEEFHGIQQNLQLDPDLMKLMRRAVECVVQGSSRDELLEDASQIA